MMMKVLELFCGTKSISNAFRERGHEVYTVDWEKDFAPTLCADIGQMTVGDVVQLCGGKPDVIWASPDCTSYSVAGIGHHRRKNTETGELDPISQYALFCDDVNRNVVKLIRDLNPKYFFIENPRGGFRKMLFVKDIPRYTVTYCQYGYPYMKPTDIFTNHPHPDFKPPCKNGFPCHQPSPRGSQQGMTAIRSKRERARIPKELCKHIVDICEV
jgi:hypothetical protein